jgi:hypothetical protein
MFTTCFDHVTNWSSSGDTILTILLNCKLFYLTLIHICLELTVNTASLCRPIKNMSNNCNKIQNEESTNSNTNNSKFGNKRQSVTTNTSNPLKVCHQNIRGLTGKRQELFCSFLSDPPHIICLTEHHLKEYEVSNILIDNYVLGARYCRTVYKNGGVCIFIHNSIKFNNILLEKYCI